MVIEGNGYSEMAKRLRLLGFKIFYRGEDSNETIVSNGDVKPPARQREKINPLGFTPCFGFYLLSLALAGVKNPPVAQVFFLASRIDAKYQLPSRKIRVCSYRFSGAFSRAVRVDAVASSFPCSLGCYPPET